MLILKVVFVFTCKSRRTSEPLCCSCCLFLGQNGSDGAGGSGLLRSALLAGDLPAWK